MPCYLHCFVLYGMVLQNKSAFVFLHNIISSPVVKGLITIEHVCAKMMKSGNVKSEELGVEREKGPKFLDFNVSKGWML